MKIWIGKHILIFAILALYTGWVVAQEASPDAVEEPIGTSQTLEATDATVGPPLPAEISLDALVSKVPWKPPVYSGQTGALGWNDGVFSIPPGFEHRVAFWKDIYTKYTTDQGVIHDSVYIDVVYTPVDFADIMSDTSLTPRQKSRAREKRLKEMRKLIEERLARLHKASSAEGLEGEDLRIWKLFESIDDKNKFVEAARRGRIRFQLGQKDRFEKGLYYSGRYLREMESIFRQEGLPIELTRLPFVESSFNIYARSRVGASGIWQFMRRTAKSYMQVGTSVDERNDPLKATRSAARLLRSNYAMLQAWPLAVTGYNHGPNGVARIVKKLGTQDLVKIVDNYSSAHFGFASENFYACFLAALQAEQEANKYFGDVQVSSELQSVEFLLNKPLPYKAVLALFDGNEDLAELYNPHFQKNIRRGREPVPRRTFIRVPLARREMAQGMVEGKIAPQAVIQAAATRASTPTPVPVTAIIPVAEEKTISPPPNMTAPDTGPPATTLAPAITAAAPEKPVNYQVRRGDNLIKIANELGVDVKELKKVNGLTRHKIWPGQVLKVPER